jgi:glyoxylase-like metal-dependent hydrolase (beta-lactamase superfamily II)
MMTVKTFISNPISVNTYLLYDETREAALIDCGCYNRHEEEALKSFIADNNLILKRLLCTHYHFDHVIGNRFIFDTYGITPEIHRQELGESVPNLTMQARNFGLLKYFEDVDFGHFIEDDEEIRFGTSSLRSLLVPGHSPASLAFYSAADGVVFTGDTLFSDSIGRTDLWGGDYNTLITSIKTRLLTLPRSTVVYPGHEETTTIGSEADNNAFLR